MFSLIIEQEMIALDLIIGQQKGTKTLILVNVGQGKFINLIRVITFFCSVLLLSPATKASEHPWEAFKDSQDALFCHAYEMTRDICLSSGKGEIKNYKRSHDFMFIARDNFKKYLNVYELSSEEQKVFVKSLVKTSIKMREEYGKDTKVCRKNLELDGLEILKSCDELLTRFGKN